MSAGRRLAAAAFALALLGALQPSQSATTLGQREVEESLTCQCGCGLTVAACNHLECSFAVPVRKNITESLARGETGEQILERYMREYGEKVLSSPVPEGFNLLAWIGPYLAIVVAGTAMFVFFRRRAAGDSPQQQAAPASQPTDPRLEQLQHEVEDLQR